MESDASPSPRATSSAPLPRVVFFSTIPWERPRARARSVAEEPIEVERRFVAKDALPLVRRDRLWREGRRGECVEVGVRRERERFAHGQYG
jgi:hypothetical protein